MRMSILSEVFFHDRYIRAAKIRIVLSEMVHVSQSRVFIETKLTGKSVVFSACNWKLVLIIGIRYYMYHWYFSVATVCIGILFVIQVPLSHSAPANHHLSFHQTIGALIMIYVLWLQCGRPELPGSPESSVGYGNNLEGIPELRRQDEDDSNDEDLKQPIADDALDR